LRLDAGHAEEFGRPPTMGDIEQQRARSLRHIDGAFSGELEANVILGQQHVGDAFPVVRFVFTHPKQLGEGEIRERCITGEIDETIGAELFREFPDLGFGALIAPDECGADHLIVAIEQNCAMHLPGKSDAGNLIAGGGGRGESAADS
jgi:hypothetical protein